MRIKNNYSETVHWRAFKGDDTVYTIGLSQGKIEPNTIITWRDDSFPQIKVEVKTGDIVFSDKVLARAGQMFNMVDDLVVNADGTLTVATLEMMGQRNADPIKVTTISWIDARNFNSTQSREVVAKLSNAVSLSQGFEQSHEHSQTWSVDATVGGTIGGKSPEGIKASGNAEISAGFEDKVVDKLQNTYSKQVSSVWENSVKDSYTFEPGFIYGIEVSWIVAMEEGTISYFDERTSYTVVKSAKGSMTATHKFKSVAEMPANLKSDFEQYS